MRAPLPATARSLPDWRAIKSALGRIPHTDDPAMRRFKSRDFFWFSPILKPLLDGKTADLIVSPQTEADVIATVSLAARFRIPLTARGGGTGTRGQAVPLDGGIVLDLSGLGETLWVRPGVGRFQAGARMIEIDRALKPCGQELRIYPATRKQATIGGFVAGGSAGVGSCTWGQIADLGMIMGLKVVTVETTPRLVELRGTDVGKVIQAAGVNGVITEVEMALAPRHDWAERILTFDTLTAAAGFGHDLASRDAIAKRLVSVHDPRIAGGIRRLSPLVPEGRAMALVMVSEPQAETVEVLAARHGGETIYRRTAEEAERVAYDGLGEIAPLYEYAWNYTTLHWLRQDPSVTGLQLRFPAGRRLDDLPWIEKTFRDELLLHLEFERRCGAIGTCALPIVRFSTRERLAEIIDTLRAHGMEVDDPHSDRRDATADQIAHRQDVIAFKREADPHGLLNPGKLGE